MYVKCEFFNPMASVKDRLAIGIIEDAERRGALKPGQTVVEATSGNTGIALAMVCAAKGYPFVAVMAETFSVERRKIMRMLGAKVILTPAAERGTRHGAQGRRAGARSTAGSWRASSRTRPTRPTTAAPPARRSWRDFAGKRLDFFVTGWGTGGTLTGAGRDDQAARGPTCSIIVAEPAGARCWRASRWRRTRSRAGRRTSFPPC